MTLQISHCQKTDPPPKKILAASSMNGGAEAIAPVIKRLRAMGVDVFVVSLDAADSTFKSHGIPPDLCLTGKWDLSTSPANTLELAGHVSGCDSVLTGTQTQNPKYPITLEQLAWSVSRQHAIPSLAVLDTWANYIERFSDLDVSASVPYPIRRRLSQMPDRIAIMDMFAMQEMVKLGFPSNVLEVTGNPYFEHVFDSASGFSAKTRSDLLSKPVFANFHKSQGAKLVVFISDSIEGAYPDIGFTEKSVLQSFLKTIDELAQLKRMEINVIVRPHPFRNQNAAEAYACDTPNLRKVLHNPVSARGSEPQNDYSIEKLLYSADLVVGTFNNPLVSAAVLRGDSSGPKIINYLPGVSEGRYRFQAFLSDQGITSEARDEAPLSVLMSGALDGSLIQRSMEAIRGATDRIITLL